MVFFRCTVGGSGKGNAVTVTCAEEFAGLTITLAKTGKTYTKTCPSTSPYVVTFYGVENGNYTVSATYGGRTYSESVVVQDISCVLYYGFNWQIWVDTASQLDSSDYDSLDEVLADEKALRELFLEHACVDYMAELTSSNEDLETVINNDLCAKWINLSDYALDYLYANEVIADLMDEADKYFYGEWALVGQVPKMTSNTAPYGVASAQDYLSDTYAPWKAFTGNYGSQDGDRWVTSASVASGSSATRWIQYKFVSATHIDELEFKPYASDTYRFTAISLKVSNDGTNFDTEIYSDSIVRTVGTVYRIPLSYNGEYTYYRLYVTCQNTSGSTANVPQLNVFQLNKWAPKGNVPVMTSNTAPYGTVAVSDYFTSQNQQGFCAFDDLETTAWATNGNAGSKYIYYKFVNPVCVKRLYWHVHSGTIARINSAVTISGSNDGSNWDSLVTIAKADVVEFNNLSVTNNTYYLYYRLSFTSTTDTVNTLKLQFYGRELKVSVPVMTSDTAPYGTASATIESNVQAWNAFKGYSDSSGNRSGWWVVSNSLPQSLYYEFTTPIVPKLFKYENSYNSSEWAVSTNIYGSEDGTGTYELLCEATGSQGANKKFAFVIENPQNKAYKKFEIRSISGINWCVFSNVNIYGLDYSEKEFESGTTKKWLYDHGVELEPMTAAATNSATMTKGSDYAELYLTGTNTISQLYTTSKIDMSDYSLFRGRIGNKLNNITNKVALSVSSSVRTYNDTPTAANSITTPPDVWYLDISSVNSEQYCTAFQRNQSENHTQTARIVELWLE